LGHQPPSDAFLRAADLNGPETSYPLDVYFCNDCKLVQLGYAVPGEILFKDYVYNTASNNSLKLNFEALVKMLVQKYGLTSEHLAVDVGSNDGTLLSYYIPYGVKILGIDPSSVATSALKKGIPTVNEFFSESVAEGVVSEHGVAKIITSTNTFAHIEDLDSIMRGIKKLLARDGVFISESHYLLDLIEKMQYDAIYHEHLRYYSLLALKNLFDRYDMEIVDAERISTHGGSIRVYAANQGAYRVTSQVKQLIALEKKSGLDKKATFEKYADKVTDLRFELIDLILKLKGKGKTIVGIGAPAKGNTLLNYCKLDPQTIDYLAEKSQLKIGLFAPGSHIPVVDEKQMSKDKPNYGLLLSWNIADELIPKLKKAGFKGKFIVPNPKLRIV
jgi:SAM-dependent methyltransferase